MPASCDPGEVPAQHDLAVGLHHHTGDPLVCAGIEVFIHASVRVQAHHVAARLAVDGGEQPYHQHFAVRLQCNPPRGECAAHLRIEAAIDCAICVQPHDLLVELSAHVCERAPRQNLAVGLNDQLRYSMVWSGVERRVHRAIRVQPRNAGNGQPADVREVAADQDLAVRLHRNRRHPGAEAVGGVGIERCVQRAIDIQPCKAVARLPRHLGEIAAQQQFAVWLDCNDMNGGISAGIETAKRGLR